VKPKILICSDSPALDTGFGRVAREIGTGLVMSGEFNVASLGWFHHFASDNDRLVPFRIFPTDLYNSGPGGADAYGQYTYPRVVESFRPDLVIFIGDEWMIRHAVRSPRRHKLIAYVPIDSAPILHAWADTFRMVDQVVAYGSFGEQSIRRLDPTLNVTKIPHGVHTDTFQPLLVDDKFFCKRELGLDTNAFVVGCVARNNSRKNLPRLIKAFRQFVNPGSSCQDCGEVSFRGGERCNNCGSTSLVHTEGKSDAQLYLHTVMNEPSIGHNLHQLINRFGLEQQTRWPKDLAVARGVSDVALNRAYNAMDVFSLPTGGEGWGLPILEAMSAGLPVLVTNYSGHVEFVAGAGELLNVSEFDTDPSTHGERAIVDIKDYVMKLDRFYYPAEKFIKRWGAYLREGGVDVDTVAALPAGVDLRRQMGERARVRAEQFQWSPIIGRWTSLIFKVLDRNPLDLIASSAPSPLSLEIL
jgi:glycosyltransferase involved in cell wall biosynthesis